MNPIIQGDDDDKAKGLISDQNNDQYVQGIEMKEIRSNFEKGGRSKDEEDDIYHSIPDGKKGPIKPADESASYIVLSDDEQDSKVNNRQNIPNLVPNSSKQNFPHAPPPPPPLPPVVNQFGGGNNMPPNKYPNLGPGPNDKPAPNNPTMTNVYNQQPNNGPQNNQAPPNNLYQNQPMYQQQPPMQPKCRVNCPFCFTSQIIPAGSPKYKCFACREVVNAQVPNYQMFLCGRCNAQVMYQVGVSMYIQCTRCYTVNMVPNSHMGGHTPPPPPNYQNNMNTSAPIPGIKTEINDGGKKDHNQKEEKPIILQEITIGKQDDDSVFDRNVKAPPKY